MRSWNSKMGIVDNVKSFFYSITTEDHYASYDSPYKNSSGQSGAGSSGSRLHELNRLATINSSSQSLIEGRGGPKGSPGLSRNSSSGVVGYRPGLRSSSTNLNASEVQLQNLNSSGQPPLPSIDSLWDRIENWLEEEYPELEDNLNDGVTSADLNEFENDLGAGSLPVEFRQFYKRHDGQFRGGKPTGLIMGLTLLDLESIAEEYAVWTKVIERLEKQRYLLEQQQRNQHQQVKGESSSASQNSAASLPKYLNSFLANQRSIPPNAVQPVYSHRGWIPFVKDFCGNQLAIDLVPGPQGHWGQIIIFGRDYDIKLVVASNLQEFLFGFISDLEAGNFQIDQSNENDMYGFLESSRTDDDFMIGDDEEGQGELSFYDAEGKTLGKDFKRKISYLEVIKIRTLKKFGIPNTQNFNTTFTPQLPRGKQPISRSSSPFNPNLSTLADELKDRHNPLISLESNSRIELPKETLIDEKKGEKEKVSPDTESSTLVAGADKKADTKQESTNDAENKDNQDADRTTENDKAKEAAKDVPDTSKVEEKPESKENANETKAGSNTESSDLKEVEL